MHLMWNNLAAQKCASFIWGQTTASVHNYFHSYMEDKWPILKLYNNGWKLNELASVTYPRYKWLYLDNKGHLKAKVKSKENIPYDLGNMDHPGNENMNNEKDKTEKARAMLTTILARSKSPSSNRYQAFTQNKHKVFYLYLISIVGSILF